jgi:hypothetical protein
VTTFGDLIDDVENVVYNLGTQRDKVTALTSSVAANALSLPVVDARQIDRGFIEVDREIIAIVSTDHAANTVAVQPWGRGARGTTAATHSSGAKVTNSPRYPRFRMGVEIQQVVDSLYPDLWSVATDETNTVRPPIVAYPVPATADSIVSVSVQSIGPSRVWQPVTRWRLDKNADLTAFPTGKSIDLYSGMPPGRKIKILYRSTFGTFTNEATTVASVGLAERYRDIIKFRTAAKLIMAADVARVQMDSVEAANRAEGVQPMSATRVATQMMTYAQTRMHEERLRLLREWPSSAVRSN